MAQVNRVKRSRIIILASGSQKRAELLKQIGIPFRVVVSGCAENMQSTKNAHALARQLSRDKARCVALQYPRALVIGADTFGVIGKTYHGKPKDFNDAKRIVRALSGRMHRVITGVTIIDGQSKKERSISAQTKVWFRKITNDEVKWYARTRDWEGKGAGYTLFGRAARFIERIDGEPGTVLGLPVCMLTQALKEFGV